MKKWVGIVLAVIILAVASFYVYQVLNQVKVGALESIVPSDAVYYVYSYNLDKKIKDFQANNFSRQFASSVLYKKFFSTKVESVKEKMPIISTFIERDVAIAIFSVSGMTYGNDDVGDFLLLIRVDPKKFGKVKEELANKYMSMSSKDKVSNSSYSGVRITSYKMPKGGMDISYAFLGDTILLGNSMDIIKKSIDLSKNKSRDSLANNSDFQKVSSRVKKDALLWGYQNNANYYKSMMRQFASGALKAPGRGASPEAMLKMKPFLNLMNVFKGYAYYIDYDGMKEGLVFKAYHAFDRSKDEDGILDIFAPDMSVDKNVYNLIPRDIVAFYAGVQDFPKAWNYMGEFFNSLNEIVQADMKANPRSRRARTSAPDMTPAKALEQVQGFLGVDIKKEILPALGNNFGVVFVSLDDAMVKFTPPEQKPGMPPMRMPPDVPIVFPQVVAFFELKDTAKMSAAMEKLTKNLVENTNKAFKEDEKNRKEKIAQMQKALDKDAATPQQPAQPQEEKNPISLSAAQYNGVDIHSLDLLNFPVQMFKPNYFIIDKYLVFSLSAEEAQKIIDIYKNKRNNLVSNFDFNSAQEKMPLQYLNIMFFDMKRLLDDLTSTTFFKTAQAQMPKRSPVGFSRDDLDSLLELLDNIKIGTFTNRLSDSDSMESTMTFKINGL